MEWLNYHHLLYFWTVAREGTIAQACKKLHLTQPTISSQLRLLERSLDAKLFDRVGRNLVLTAVGRSVYRYADEIFSLGRDLCSSLKGRPSKHGLRLEVGVADVLPRWVVGRLLEPVLQPGRDVQVICHDDKTERLMSRLALNELDVVLSDIPAGPLVKVRAHNHLLGECGVLFFVAKKLAAKYRHHFPKSLDGAPFIMPMEGTALRRSLDEWFDKHGIQPIVNAEVSDCDMLEVFAQIGAGIVVVPAVIEQRIRLQFQLQLVGRVEAIREKYFAITTERKLKHPGVIAISTTARRNLFG